MVTGAAWLGVMAAGGPLALLPASASAAQVALAHLQGVGKQLQNEGLVFNKETVEHLKDAIKAIKELEEERKQAFELWEEETIKNCTLRDRVKGFPELVMKEFEALIAAAHRTRLSKLSELETSLKEITAAIQSTNSRQLLAEEQNVVLCEEQERLRDDYEKMLDLLNETMAEKHKLNININELHNMKKKAEKQIVRQKGAVEEVQKSMSKEATEFEERKRFLEDEIKNLQSRLNAKKLEIAEKKKRYEEWIDILIALQKQVAEYKQMISARREELAKLLKEVKQLIKIYEKAQAEKEELLRQRGELQNEFVDKDSQFLTDKNYLLQQLQEAEEKRDIAARNNEVLKNENDLLNTQYQALTSEENRFYLQRNGLAEEFEQLSTSLTDKLDRVAKRLMEIKDLEEELEKLQDIYDTTQCSYSREISALEETLKKESERRSLLQGQLAEITEKFKKMQAAHDELVSKTQGKIDAGRLLLSGLMKQNDRLNNDILDSEEMIKHLTQKLHRKEAQFKKRDANMLTELKKLEAAVSAKNASLLQKEKLLKLNLPLSEEMKQDLDEKNTDYDNQKELFSDLQEEERTLTKAIDVSLKEFSRLRRLKVLLRTDIQANRIIAFERLQIFTNSLKHLERDNYEVDRKLYILTAENARLRAGIAYLREDIATMDREASLYRFTRQHLQCQLGTQHDLFMKTWQKEKHYHQMFLRHEHAILKMLTDCITRQEKRNETLVPVCEGLQLNFEGLDALLGSKSTITEEA